MKSKLRGVIILLGVLTLVVGCKKQPSVEQPVVAEPVKVSSEDGKTSSVGYVTDEGVSLQPGVVAESGDFLYVVVTGSDDSLETDARRLLGAQLRTVTREQLVTNAYPASVSFHYDEQDGIISHRITLDGNTLRTEEAPIVPLALVEVVEERQGWLAARIPSSVSYDKDDIRYLHFPDGDGPFVLPVQSFDGVGKVVPAENGVMYTIGWGKRGGDGSSGRDVAIQAAEVQILSSLFPYGDGPVIPQGTGRIKVGDVQGNPAYFIPTTHQLVVLLSDGTETVSAPLALQPKDIVGWKRDSHGNALVLARFVPDQSK
jgi:hypothetical protein